jgi:hypothetical protein
MKKLSVLLLVITAFTLQYCSSTRKASKAQEPKVTYDANIHPLMVANCTPCHFPPKGNKKAYDNYLAVKTDIDSILTRIQKNPNERGFMPFKHPKLSDSTINVFVQWKKDGLLEK